MSKVISWAWSIDITSFMANCGWHGRIIGSIRFWIFCKWPVFNFKSALYQSITGFHYFGVSKKSGTYKNSAKFQKCQNWSAKVPPSISGHFEWNIGHFEVKWMTKKEYFIHATSISQGDRYIYIYMMTHNIEWNKSARFLRNFGIFWKKFYFDVRGSNFFSRSTFELIFSLKWS